MTKFASYSIVMVDDKISLVLLMNHKAKYNNVDASHRNQWVTTLKSAKVCEEKAQ